MNRGIARVATFLILVIIVAGILLIKSESSRSDMKEQLKVYKQQLDTVNYQLDSLETQYRVLSKHLKDMYGAYQEAKKELTKAKNDYKNTKNSPIIKYTDPQLDSILSAEYPR